MTNEPNFIAGQPSEGKVGALIAWALFILSIPSANVLVLVGLVVSYVTRGTATGVARQHTEAQIRLFWSVFWWTIAAWVGVFVSIPLMAVGIGFVTIFVFGLALLVLSIWFTIKSVIGLLNLLNDKPI
ncbi:hypothetical protein [Brevundimonas vesicularis]|uniref:Transmembrane protein n=1 Tax=Brevundimonas vesicularis TaxID=41276 RepID=A0A1Z3UAE0_BREVE|nr:hypothetical protein [Brevundimonas vesicularis]ASE40256.1 hypothetical protein CEP68_12475 [Brevundimonas vesicularis]MDX2334272.1 hypothetical protein [Brevundimonas vesicularis]